VKHICEDIKQSDNSLCEFLNVDNGLCRLNNHYRCLEEIALNSMVLSHSTVQNALRCKRLLWYRDILGKILKPQYLSEAIKMGSLWDKAQEIIYKTGKETPESLAQYYRESQMNEFSLAKVRAVYRAYNELIEPEIKNLIGLQQHFLFEISDADITCPTVTRVHGFYDRLYSDHFTECKFTSNKVYYDNIFAIQSQIGTYFLANPNLEYVMMEIIETPKQKPLRESKSRNFSETSEEYENRVYNEIIQTPSKYFIGIDRKEKKYGLRFSRSEFDLNEISSRYKFITQEIRDAIHRNSFYINDKACYMYGAMCEYYNICSTGGYADASMFMDREKIKANTNYNTNKEIENG